MTNTLEPPTFADVLRAKKTIAPYLTPTPLVNYPLLDDVIELLEGRPGHLWWAAEAYRLRARAHASLGDSAAARIDFARAEQEATASGARLFLLRALLDRARLFPGRPEGVDAARQLARLQASFSPGEDLPELAAAREVAGVVAGPVVNG